MVDPTVLKVLEGFFANVSTENIRGVLERTSDIQEASKIIKEKFLDNQESAAGQPKKDVTISDAGSDEISSDKNVEE